MPQVNLSQAARIAIILMLLGLAVIVVDKLAGGLIGGLKQATPFN